MRLIWGKCRCTICHCPNSTKNDNHLCGACYHPYDADEDHQGLNQITLKPMNFEITVSETIFQKLLKIIERLSIP